MATYAPVHYATTNATTTTGFTLTNGPMAAGSATTYIGGVRTSYQEYECGIHDVKYKAFSPGCPVCELERQIEGIRKALASQTNESARLHEENHLLQIQVDFLAAIRDAASLLSSEDAGFLKLALYQWRDEKSVSVRPTRSSAGAINGFLVTHRSQEPVAIECNSVGGLAIAEYLGEAINTYGPQKALEIVTRALSIYLTGSLS